MNDVCKHNQLYLLECIAGMMRWKYSINIALNLLYFYKSTGIMCQHNYKYALSLHYVPLIICFVVLKMNAIQ